MADTPSVQADDANGPDGANVERSQFGAGETGGGKPADGIDGNLAITGQGQQEGDADDVAVAPEEDPKMGV